MTTTSSLTPTVTSKRWHYVLASTVPSNLAGFITFGYNAAVRRAIGPALEQRVDVLKVAFLYIVLSMLVGLVAGLKVANQRQLDRASNEQDAARHFLSFLKKRMVISTVCWLGSIPVMGVFTLVRYGALIPLGFTHFCASIVIAWMITLIYSALFNCACFANESGQNGVIVDEQIRTILRRLPWAASGIPIVVALMFLFFSGRVIPTQSGSLILDRFLLLLLMCAGYGAVYCYWRVRKMCSDDLGVSENPA